MRRAWRKSSAAPEVLDVVLVLVVLVLVVLVVAAPLRRGRAEAAEASETARREALEAAKDAKYAEIRDAELDYRTGKLSEADWRAQDRALRAEAIEILRQLDAL
jgi:flagellar biosynthesis/type III secretory pathway M-ring protein FliF/YscJ